MSRGLAARHWATWTRSRSPGRRPRRSSPPRPATARSSGPARPLPFSTTTARSSSATASATARTRSTRPSSRARPTASASTTVFALGQDHFGAPWTERPALVRFGRRMADVRQLRHARHEALVDRRRSTPTRSRGSPTAEVRTAFAGDVHTAVKDPIVRLRRRRLAGVDLLPPARPPGRGGPHEQRLRDERRRPGRGTGTAPCSRAAPGEWDARGARLTTILPDGRAAYDGRASAEENWFERTGHRAARRRPLRLHRRPGGRRPLPRGPAAPGGGYRIYYEARLPDESHELRTELMRVLTPARAGMGTRRSFPPTRSPTAGHDGRSRSRPARGAVGARRRGAAARCGEPPRETCGRRSRGCRARSRRSSPTASGSGGSAPRRCGRHSNAACDAFRPT